MRELPLLGRLPVFGVLLCCLCLQGCFFTGSGGGSGGGHAYNPYIHSRLPTAETSEDLKSAIKASGGQVTSIQGETSYRKNWKEEVYPVVFGDKKAPDTVLVFLDYAAPASQQVWSEVLQIVPKLDPRKVQIVVFGNSHEQYGTELMGFGIWVAQHRPYQQSLAYYAYTLNQWNDVKRRQQSAMGKQKLFCYEFDATAAATEQPFVYNVMESLNPRVPEKQQQALLNYAYDAGNINMFQAVQLEKLYGIKALPAVVVNNTVLQKISAATILAALH